MTVFQNQETRIAEPAQAQQAMHEEQQARVAEAQSLPDLHAAMRELADSVLATKGDIDQTKTAITELTKRKEEEIRQIVEEAKKMMETMSATEKERVSLVKNVTMLGEEMKKMGALNN